MSTQLTIPKLEMSMTEGTLTEWLVKDGAQVQQGDAIYALETGKSIQEITAPAAGTLKIHARTGEVYPVGTLIAEIT